MKLSRRQFALGVGGLGLAAAAGALAVPKRPHADFAARSGRRPNVLLILTDQEQHPDFLPSDLALPMRWKIQERATRFSKLQNISALCSMARGNIYTGQHYQHTGVSENVPIPLAHNLSERVPTLGTMMQDAGYETAYFGKWHLSKEPINAHHAEHMRRLFASYGFEYSDQPSEVEGTLGGFRHDGETAAAATRFIMARQSAERPWFAAVNFVNPHDIMFLEATHRQFETLHLSKSFGDGIVPPPQAAIYQEDLGYDLPSWFGTRGDVDTPPAHAVYRTVTDNALGRIPLDDREAWRVYQNYYFNCLRDVDRRIGEVFAALERSGELANTIVVLTSDHGELGGAHGLRAKGNTIYRQTAALPLAILHPDIKDGADTPALASQLDFAPTLLAFAGISAQERADQLPALKGVDLSRAMGPGAARSLQAAGRTATYYQWDSMVYASADAPALAAAASSHTGLDRARYLWRLEHAVRDASTRHHLRGAYDGRYKFARYFRPVDRSRPTDWDSLTQANDLELYDTLTDPFERVNLAYRPEYRDEVLRMSGIVNHLIATEVGSSDAPPSLLLI